MKPRTALHVLRKKNPTFGMDREHVAACIIDLEDKQGEPFVIEIIDPSYNSTSRDFRAQRTAQIKMLFSPINNKDEIHKLLADYKNKTDYITDEMERKDIDRFLKISDVKFFQEWQEASKKQFTIHTIYSDKTLDDFKKAYAKKFPNSTHGDFFDENFDSCNNNCTKPVNFAMDFFSQSTKFDKAYRVYQTVGCVFGLFACWELKCCPAPPCYDTPISVAARANFRATKSYEYFFSPHLKTPLLEKSTQNPQRQVMKF